MARSTVIYVVFIGGKLHSAFTVKHETKSALARLGKFDINDVKVFRVKDNSWTFEAPVDITDEFFEVEFK